MLHEGLEAQTFAQREGDNSTCSAASSRQMDWSREGIRPCDQHPARHVSCFSDDDEVTAFLRANRTAAPLLIEAFPHMSRAFADTPILLDLMSEEESQTINALALWWGKRDEARAALRKFDDEWWLDNIGKANGRIVFDYQIEVDEL